MKQIIEKRTELERKFKAKQQELDNVKQQITEINNTDFFDMTFEIYVKKSTLQEYHHNQSDQLHKQMNEVRFDKINGDLKKIVSNYIKQQADDCPTVVSKFIEFESDPSNKVLAEAYYSTFNEKVDKLHDEVKNALVEYFKVMGEEIERPFKIMLERELPAPITQVNVETKRDSASKGAPYDYANRKSTRK